MDLCFDLFAALDRALVAAADRAGLSATGFAPEVRTADPVHGDFRKGIDAAPHDAGSFQFEFLNGQFKEFDAIPPAFRKDNFDSGIGDFKRYAGHSGPGSEIEQGRRQIHYLSRQYGIDIQFLDHVPKIVDAGQIQFLVVLP